MKPDIKISDIMKKTLVFIFAALLTVSAATASAFAAETSDCLALEDRKPKKKAKGEIKEVIFHVHLHCANCVKKVQENIAFERGVKDLKVSLEDQTVTVKYDASKTSEEALKAAIAELGYPVIGVLAPGQKVEHHHHDHKH